MERRKVVVTGLGVVSPIGNDIPGFWESVKAGRSGIGPISLVDASDMAVRIAGEVKGFDPTLRIDPKEAKKMDRYTQFSVFAAAEALADAGLSRETMESERTGVCIGTGQGGSGSIEEAVTRLVERGPTRVPPLTVAKALANFGPAQIAMTFNITGPCQCIVTACAAGTDAIGQAMRLIRDDQADTIIAGGSEASIVRMCMSSFINIQALSARNEEPEKASRPFDRDRDGFVMAEGAGVLVLEEYQHALARGAKIYAEVAGFGQTCDAHHLTAPDPEGVGVSRAIRLALADARLNPDDIDWVSAHGTSTPLNDPIETKAIKSAFGDHAKRLKVSSLKSMTGHCIGAAGAIEAIAGILGMREGYVHATINYENPDPACDLDYVPNKGVSMPIRAFIKNSMGFGGQNAVVVFKTVR
ncbi:MAG: beta-ketoacyl-ACP synthase II [Spirochaetia bacterium]|jgi:3-oxoacyl-[acyl-carrier-protein] synthase II|nr:beta-ketoacyl-ACP synthase II [Spirochaetia bacterium]MCE1208723.1 beta-ketoacyl-ACP synthase II [Spirochaetia bacterium]NLX45386.1 beta-ketoacyl-ACP synthase II [Treponema sp.]HOI23553.1 beta-ketoacyl-ACP synthase II [Spirochaetales bacterium]